MKWIDIRNSKPHEHLEVLFYLRNLHEVFEDRISQGTFFETDTGEAFYALGKDGCTISDGNFIITHWTLLPDSPHFEVI